MIRLARAALGVACGVALLAPAPASATGVGFNIQSLVNWSTIWGQPYADLPWEPYLAAMQRDGLTVARTDAAWSAVQPTGPGDDLADPANWVLTDRIARSLAERGITWLPVVDLTPAWAAATHHVPSGCSPVIGRYLPPAERYMDEFAAFAGALAARYGTGGTFWAANPDVTPRPIRDYEIWNEANVDAYWNNDPNPATYRVMYDLARTAIKNADPSARVLVAGVVWGGVVNCRALTVNAGDWLRGFIGAAPGPVDGVAMHPYASIATGVVANVRVLRKALVAAGRPNLPLEQTELGWALRADDAPPTSAAVRSGSYYRAPARAGMYALTIDMLRGSDCSGSLYLGYAAVERERASAGENPLGVGPFDFIEHWMGVYGFGSTGGVAPPTVTSTAIAEAAARESSGVNAPRDVRVCGEPRGGRVLPLTLDITAERPGGCFASTVRYRGLPVGGAELRGTPAVGTETGTPGRDPVFTDIDGNVVFCLSAQGDTDVTAQVGAGSYAEDFAPLVAQSAPVRVSVASPPSRSPEGASGPPPAPACILTALTLPPQRLSTVLRRGGLRAAVTLSTLAAGQPCQATLTLAIPVRSKPGAPRKVTAALVGAATVTVATPGAPQAVTVRLSKAGRKRLQRERNVQATVKIGLPQAPIGLQEHTRLMRLRR